jgi:hypothetical protein
VPPPPPPLAGSGSGRVASAPGGSAATRGAGATIGGEAGDHLNSRDLAAALQASTIAGVLPAMRLQQAAAAAAASRGDAPGSAAARAEPQFLHHERRGLWGQSAYNIGYSYFGGLAAGGLYGTVWGLRRSPNAMPRVLLNSLLNGSGKYGARAGNAAGVLAMVYTGELEGGRRRRGNAPRVQHGLGRWLIHRAGCVSTSPSLASSQLSSHAQWWSGSLRIWRWTSCPAPSTGCSGST